MSGSSYCMPLGDFSGALHLDLATRSAIDLIRAGPWKYAQHPSTELRCVSYAVGDGPIVRWRPGEPVPLAIVAHVNAGLPIVAYGISFERAAWQQVVPRTPRQRCPCPEFHGG